MTDIDLQWVIRLPDDKFEITTEMWQSRPLSRPQDERTHNHGAWDIAPTSDAVDEVAEKRLGGIEGVRGIYAPEDGKLSFWIAVRDDRGHWMGEARDVYQKSVFDIKDHYYFYDIYGAMAILKGKSGLTHVFTHIEASDVFNHLMPYLERKHKWMKDTKPKALEYSELQHSGENGDRFPMMFWSNMDRSIDVRKDALIGTIGNAGYSTGPHIHYEVHPGTPGVKGSWVRHRDRVDPKDLYADVWEKHKDDHRRFYDYEEHKARWS